MAFRRHEQDYKASRGSRAQGAVVQEARKQVEEGRLVMQVFAATGVGKEGAGDSDWRVMGGLG